MRRHFRVVWPFVIIVGGIFVAEGMLMLLLDVGAPTMASWSPWAIGILDATMLTLVLVPLLHFLVFRPLAKELENRQRIERFKDQFTYIIPHELRSPLTAMGQGVELLDEEGLGPLPADYREVLDTIKQQLGRLQYLVEKIDLAQQSMLGDVEYVFEPFDVAPMMHALEQLFRPIAASKHQRLRFEQSELSEPCVGDAAHLQRAVRELIDNALQVTPADGEVTRKPEALLLGTPPKFVG